MKYILLTVFAFLFSTLEATEKLKLEVKQENPQKDIRFLNQTSFEVSLINTSDQPINVVDPNKSDRFYNTHRTEKITIVNGQADSSSWFMERAESVYSAKNIISLKPGDRILVNRFSITPKDTLEHTLIVNHEQMINPHEAVVEVLGQKTVDEMKFRLSAEFRFKPTYVPVTKDEFNDSYSELIAPPKKSEKNPSMRILKYSTYSLTEALKNDSTNKVYKVTISSDEMSLARFLPILKNIRWIQLNIENTDSIPEGIAQLNKMMHLSVKVSNPKNQEEIKPVYIEPIKTLNNLRFLDLSNTYLPTTPEWLGNFKDLSVLSLSNAFYEYTPTLGELTNLKELHIDGKLNQDFPKEIGHLRKIKDLVIRSVQTSISKEILASPELETLTISSFTNSIDFAGCPARKIEIIQLGKLNEPLTGMQNLTQLDSLLLTTKSSDIPDLSNCTSLKYLSYTNSVITEFPEKLTLVPALEELNMQCANLSNISPRIGDLKQLTFLTFFRSKTQTLPDAFSNLTNLKRMVLSYSPLSQFPSVLLKMDNLENLSLHHNQITELPKEIAQLKNLKYLSLASNKLKSVPKEIGELAVLEILDLSDNEIISIPNEIGNLNSLKDLSLNNNQLKTLPNSIFQLPSLEKIYLRQNPLNPSVKKKAKEQTRFKAY